MPFFISSDKLRKLFEEATSVFYISPYPIHLNHLKGIPILVKLSFILIWLSHLHTRDPHSLQWGKDIGDRIICDVICDMQSWYVLPLSLLCYMHYHVILNHVILDHFILNHVILNHVILGHVILNHVTLDHVILNHVILYHVILNHVILDHVIWLYWAMLYCTMLYWTMLYWTMV